MSYILTFIIALFGSTLTFFSGFGLGTILLPLFLAFFEPKLAIPAAALVHFSNSIFKFAYVRKHIYYPILWRFGIPAVLAAFLGAECLKLLGNSVSLITYNLFDHNFEITAIGVLIGSLILIFTWFESSKWIKSKTISSKHLITGGLLSGFFGGLSGHQGALRSLFLKQTELTKEQLLGTSNAISLGIDIVRISIYIQMLYWVDLTHDGKYWIIITGIFAAFIGVTLGNKLLKKVTLNFVHQFISVFLMLFGVLMILGVI